MPAVNETLDHRFDVVDVLGAAVTGLTGADFTVSLLRLSGGAFVAAAETVTITEDAAGRYFASYAPANTGLYTLDISHATHIVTLFEREDWVGTGFATTAGPYLTTRANVKLYARIESDDTSKDAIIDSLLDGVTRMIEMETKRVFFEAALTEYPDVKGCPCYRLFVARPPIVSVSSLWLSTAWPRVYGADELLTDGTDYTYDDAEEGGIVELAAPRYLSLQSKQFKLSYTGGFATVPADVELAARRIVCAELFRSSMGGVAGLSSLNRGDGSIGFDNGVNVGGFTVDMQSKATLEHRTIWGFR